MDSGAFNSALDQTGAVTLLNAVATGTDFTNRIGRKVCWKSVLIQGHTSPTANIAAGCYGRIMIIYDSQPNGALPSATDVLLSNAPNSPMNLNNRDRFKILWDKRVTAGAYNVTASTAVADRTVTEVRKYKKINLETIFDGTTAAIADIQSGSIFMLTTGSATAGNGLTLNCTVRMRFNDA